MANKVLVNTIPHELGPRPESKPLPARLEGLPTAGRPQLITAAPVRIENPALTHLLPALQDLHAWLTSRSVPYVVTGGVALCILSRSRLVAGLDVCIDSSRVEDLADLMDRARGFGFCPPASGCATGLAMMHGPSTISVILQATADPVVSAAMARALAAQIEGVLVPLARAVDFSVIDPANAAEIGAQLKRHRQREDRAIVKETPASELDLTLSLALFGPSGLAADVLATSA